ncbi:hypothetical protein LTR36_003161 [Oleoguttula mirabilis]|uniref:Transcription elongation factor n=1 Tax=Oleoguttula mirabilis TaxID=1507867 RepID=A0AAV9JX69_9PEZI|nr:hypothetical protein LTR36_003161 [Oleoguttula mirabilis]
MAMDTKQLLEAGKQIVKAADGGDPSSTLLTLLQPLQKTSVTEDQLRQSKIGVAVNKLRQNKDPKVASLAGQLINKWKADVAALKKGGGGKGGASPAPRGAAAVGNGTSSPALGANGKTDAVKQEAGSGPAKRKSKVAPEKRTSKLDEVDTKLTGNAVRDGCVELLYNGLAYLSAASPDDLLPVACTVERAAYDAHAQDTSQAYKAKLRSLFQNLKMKGNETLRADVFRGAISPARFVSMTSDELKSAEKRAQDQAMQEENMKQSQTPQEEKAISTTMTCGKCRMSRVAYSQAQTRAADEPMTTFCECTNCGHRWKFS